MKKNLVLLFVSGAFTLLFVSWGNAGHKVIARIAESYLSPGTRDSIKYYLGDESIEDAAVWADKVLTEPEYKNTSAWHYVELPPGLKDDYPSTIREMIESKHRDNYYASIYPDIYHAIEYEQNVVKDKKSTKQQKAIAVRFLLNLVADASEPMYICRAWNWDGNSLQRDLDNKYRTLQADREDSILKTEGTTFTDIAAKIKNSMAAHGGRMVENEPSSWLIKSYNSGQKLYELAEKDNLSPTEYYKEESLVTINQSINQAGIRVADFLNNLFKPQYVPGTPVHFLGGGDTIQYKAAKFTPFQIPVKRAAEFIGTEVSVTAKVYGIKLSDHTTELYLDAQYPNQRLTVVIHNTKYRGADAATKLLDKTIIAQGTIVMNDCRTEMVMDDTDLKEKK